MSENNNTENIISKKRGRPKKTILEEFKNDEPQPETILVNEETKIDGIAPTLEALVKQEIKLDQLKKLFKCALQILEIS